jgi:serine protease AprX
MLGILFRGILPARLLAVIAALLIAAGASPVLAAAPAHAGAPTGLTSVIIRGDAGMLDRLEHSTVLAGGTVVRELKIINGFSADVPTARLADLRALPGVASVVGNAPLNFHSDYNPASDPYSMGNTATAVGASAAWTAGLTGAGVDVALLDSGVTPVQGLAGSGKVVNGPDISVDSQNSSTRYLDGFGHGTFMAGLIGGKDPGADPTKPGSSYLGMAPDARIVNVKVGSSSGAVDVSQVIAGIDWVVQHRHENGLNIRVLNLSIGTNSSQSYQLDPLAYAAEVAWRSGIVVVAAAGNDGATYGHLDDPASDPFVIAVGAAGSSGGSSLNNVILAAFSSLGDGTRNPDLIAPGVHLQGLRVPGSYIDQKFSSAAFGDRFFRGSGTSEAAALISGSIALLLQKRPDLNPGQVKAILAQSADALPGVSVQAQGAGLLDLGAGLSDSLSVPVGWQSFPPSAGNGSLEKARGNNHVVVNGVPVTGEADVFGHGFSAADHASQSAAGQGWGSDGSWNGTTWSGTTWTGTTWSGTTWTGTTWSGTTWSGTTWSGTTWSGTTWSGTTWSGTTWSGEIWSNYSWS